MPERRKILTRREFLKKGTEAGVGFFGGLFLPELEDPYDTLARQLAPFLPDEPGKLDLYQEVTVTGIIERTLGIPITSELEGNRLNTNYGKIGTEQHLKPFPHDTRFDHLLFKNEGITVGFGAFGKLANSKKELTLEKILKERYYLATQYHLTEKWRKIWQRKGLRGILEHKSWWKHRKMLVVNPGNGRAVVAAICDAGPGKSTGKQFGGSPEVMGFWGFIKPLRLEEL